MSDYQFDQEAYLAGMNPKSIATCAVCGLREHFRHMGAETDDQGNWVRTLCGYCIEKLEANLPVLMERCSECGKEGYHLARRMWAAPSNGDKILCPDCQHRLLSGYPSVNSGGSRLEKVDGLAE